MDVLDDMHVTATSTLTPFEGTTMFFHSSITHAGRGCRTEICTPFRGFEREL